MHSLEEVAERSEVEGGISRVLPRPLAGEVAERSEVEGGSLPTILRIALLDCHLTPPQQDFVLLSQI